MVRIKSHAGYSLFELIVVVVILGVIASVAVKSLRNVNDTARIEQTKEGLERLAYAMAGNPNLVSGGVRVDYGYVGDVGAFPPNLTALYENPGGYATWDGPYIDDAFNDGGVGRSYDKDAWGTAYSFSGVEISSTGGSTTITRRIANSTHDLLYNTVSMTVTDLDNTPPGATYKDSVKFLLTYPDGAGNLTTRAVSSGPDGFVEVDSIPIGTHNLKVVYIPDNDTIVRLVNIDPGSQTHTHIQLNGSLW